MNSFAPIIVRHYRSAAFFTLFSPDVSGTFTAPSSGTLDMGKSEFVYTPYEGFCGLDNFTYTLLSQSHNLSDTATVTIDVTCSSGEETEPVSSASNPEEADSVLDPMPGSTILKVEDDFVEGSMNEPLYIPVLVNDIVQGSESMNRYNTVACSSVQFGSLTKFLASLVSSCRRNLQRPEEWDHYRANSERTLLHAKH